MKLFPVTAWQSRKSRKRAALVAVLLVFVALLGLFFSPLTLPVGNSTPPGAIAVLRGSTAHSIQFVSNDRLLAGRYETLDTWELKASPKLTRRMDNLGEVAGFSRDGKLVVVPNGGDAPGGATIWRTGNGARRTVLKNVKDDLSQFRAAFSPDGKVVFISSPAGGGYDEADLPLPVTLVIGAYDTVTGRRIWRHTPKTSTKSRIDDYPVACAPNGRYFVHCQKNPASGWVELCTRDAHTFREIGILRLPKWLRTEAEWAHDSNVKSIDISPDSRLITTVGFAGEAVLVWEVQRGTLLWKSHDHEFAIENAIFSPDGKTIAVSGASHLKNDPLGGRLYLWNAAGGKLLRTLQRSTWTDIVMDQLETARKDARFKAWRFWRRLIGYTKYGTVFNTADVALGNDDRNGPWTGLAFSPDGKKVAIGGWRGEVVVWRVP